MSTLMTPKHRFPDFKDEWQSKELGDLLKVGSGKDYKHLGKGNVPVYGTGGLMLYVDDFLYDGKSICIGRKGTIDKPQLLTGKFWTVDTLFYTYDYNDAVPEFLYTIFQKINWQKHNEASGVPSLSKATIEKIKVTIPDKIEQKKIAEFLIAVNELIGINNKEIELLKQYKKGVIQKIFAQRLRFRDDKNNSYAAWQTKKLSEIFERVIQKNIVNDQNILTISAQQGLVSQTDYFNKVVAAKNITGYYLLSKNDFAYNKSYSAGYPMGAIKRLNKYDKGVVSTLYICFRAKDERDIDFYEQVFDTGLQDQKIEEVAQEGARNHGLLNIGVEDFFNISLDVPGNKQEQQKIASLLMSLDRKIKLAEEHLNQTKTYKNFLLQGMFV